MAGRGTDIVLGGNLEAELASQGETLDEATRERLTADWQARHDAVIEAGGLHILGTERHESRRIDNQLRGRSGRQGDPGVSRFYLSLEDNLMRIFASDRVKSFMQALGMERGEAIEHRMVTNAIEKAQRKSKDATSIFASSCSSTTMWPMTSARLFIASGMNCCRMMKLARPLPRSARTW